MHILITTDTLGGVWSFTRELVSGLYHRGHRVTLVSFGQYPDREMTSWLPPSRVRLIPTPFPLEWMQDAEAEVESAREWLADIATETCPDVIHTNQFAFASLPLAIPVVLTAHSDIFSWWQAVYRDRPPATQFHRWYEEMVQRGLRNAALVVAPSCSARDDLRRSYNFNGLCQVIHNGRSPALLNPYVPKEPFALSVGRLWDSGKQSLLLCRPGLSMETILVGPTEHPVVKSAPLPRVPGLSLPGKLSEVRVRQLFSFARVYVGTSRYEPFGLAPLEGALSRCALLLNDIPSFREIWGDTAVYFRTDDGDDLADWMTRLANDAELCRSLGAAAWRRARERYTAARMVQEYAALYQSACGSVVETEPQGGWREVV